MSDQFTVNCVVRPTSKGTETLSFSFNLGILKIVCIANIPGENEETAPVYIKLQLPDADGNYPSKNGRKQYPQAPCADGHPATDGGDF